MESPKGDNENRGPAPRFKLSGLPLGVTASDIETCFYAFGEEIVNVKVTILGGGNASAIVHGILDVEGFVKKKHRIGRHWFQVEMDYPASPSALSSPPILADTIQVTGDLPDIELLAMYFEGIKSGGGEDKEVELIKTVKEGVVHVKFSTKEDAAMVVGQEHHTVMGKVLQVCYAPDSSATAAAAAETPPDDCRVLLISCIPDGVSKDYLAQFVENRIGLEQEKGFTLDFQPPRAHLAFSSKKDLEEMAKKLMSKKLKNHKLIVEPASPSTLEEATTSLAPGKLLITDIPSGIGAEMLELFIDGVLELQSENDYTLTLKLPKAQMLLSSTHSENELEVMCQKLMSKPLKGQRLTVKLIHEVPVAVDPRKLLVSDIPQDVSEEYLALFIESRLRLQAGDYTLTVRSPKALLTFIQDHSKKELEQKCLTLMGKPLHGQLLTVELCEENRSIIVRNVVKKLYSHEALDMYFSMPSVSGEEAVEAINIMGSDTALITFKDPQVASSVLSHTHSRLGPDVSIVARSPLDSFDSQPPQQSHSDDEENFHDASTVVPSVSTQPLSISVDPLIAKYLMKNSLILSEALKSMFLSIEVDESSNIITVTPSPSSPIEWPEKAKEIVDEVLSSSVAQEVLSIPPEAASEVYPAVMKLCKEGRLQYDFNDDTTLLSLVGDRGHVSALKKQIDDLCTRFIKKSDRISLSVEEFTFLSTLQLGEVARMHPNIELQCHSNDHSVSLHGPIKYVEGFKEQLPQILDHSNVTVPLHPLGVHFLHGEHGTSYLDSMIKRAPVIPLFCTRQEDDGNKKSLSLCFLSSPDNADIAEALVATITNDIKVETHPLPKSFHNKVSTSPDFEDFKKRLHKQFRFVVNVEDDQLLVVSTVQQIQQVVSALVHHITEACSVTKTIRLKRGVWRLFHSSAANKWDLVKEAMKEKGVQFVQITKANVPKASVTIKGDSDAVEDVEKHILQLQSSVRTKEVPVSRPGICKYLFKDAAGRMVISGIEHNAKVCIELGVEEDQPTEDASAAGSQQKFTKVCWGTTNEMKTISVYVGDITEFNKAEVIVNAANEELKHVGGVALGIAKKGGPIIQKDSDDHIRQRGKVDTGSAVLFPRVGDLPRPYKAIVHAVGPRWDYGHAKERQVALLKKAVRNALVRAKQYGSIALPAISTGVYGFPVAISAGALIDAAVEFSKKEPKTALNEINIIAFSRKDAEEFRKALESTLDTIFYEGKQTAPPPKASAIVDTTPDGTSRKKRKTKTVTFPVAAAAPITPSVAPVASASVPFSSSPAIRQAALDCIKVTCGSILDITCEALVNTTDQNLGFGGYVSQALLKAAGDSLKDECEKKKPVAMGGVAVTGAGNLKCKRIIHTVLPSYDGPHGNAEKTLKSVVVECLHQCTKLGLKSIAIPSIGAGNLKYPDDVVAQCLLDETLRYLEANHKKTSLQLVHFVIFMPRTFQSFEERHRALVSGRIEEEENEEDEDLFASSQPTRDLTPSRVSGRHRNRPKASQFSQEGISCFSLPNDLMLEVALGDISDDASDVIVNPTSPNLVLISSGVQGAILRKGGQELQSACTAISKGRNCLKEGNVLGTPSYGRLQCKSVYHIHYSSNDRKKFVKTVLACLEKANSARHGSIAFPAIGTGMNNYSVSDAASGMIRALKKFVDKSKAKQHLQVVRVVLFQADVHQQFVQAFQSMDEGGEEGFLHAIVRGVKAVGSYFFANGSQDEDDDEPMDTSNKEMVETSMEEDWAIIPSVNLAIDTTVVLTIYGLTEQSVEMAEKNLRSVIDTHIVSEVIEDPSICQLSGQMVENLNKVARDHHVDIDIDQDEALHSINLRGCQTDVLALKDKVRDALAAVSKEETKADAADAVFATIRWTRVLSGEEMDDYDPMTNYEIEQAYKKKQKKFKYETEAENFEVDLTTFHETDHISSDVVPIKRRDLIKEYSAEAKPEEWDAMPTDSTGKEALVHLVKLQPGSKEFQNVESSFRATMTTGVLYTIERVQNPVLYGQYINWKKQMDKRNPPGHQNERWLFHGTNPDTCSKINAQGFNRSFMGLHGVVYGKGVYFARDARYSHGYASVDAQGYRRMYFTRVLCGEYTTGNSKMIIPPPKNPQVDQNVPFDSTVDDVNNPSIIVVYNDSQNYPAYLITYA